LTKDRSEFDAVLCGNGRGARRFELADAFV
jgi:hypothetical protein